MTPIQERVAPVAVLHITLGFLCLMTVNVADYPPHMVNVLIGVIRPIFLKDLDDLPVRLVTFRFTAPVTLADGLGLRRPYRKEGAKELQRAFRWLDSVRDA